MAVAGFPRRFWSVCGTHYASASFFSLSLYDPDFIIRWSAERIHQRANLLVGDRDLLVEELFERSACSIVII
jgi:hypothetical protein